MRVLGHVDVCRIPHEVQELSKFEMSEIDLSDAYGYRCPDEQKIYIQAGMTRVARDYLILHEGMHGVMEDSGATRLAARHVGDTKDLEESIIRAVAPHLFELVDSIRKLPDSEQDPE